MTNFSKISLLPNNCGAAIVIVGIAVFALVGFAALAIDIGHLYVVRNELQNAADAAALTGARVLYNDDGTAINSGANQTAFDAARANRSDLERVDVHWSGDNSGDVQRGHWCFSCTDPETGEKGFFTPNHSLEPVDLWNVSTDELDVNTDFINAVRVTTRREDTPAASFLARIFGHDDFKVKTSAVSYVGFAGTLEPEEADQPIAICKEALLRGEEYTCSIGRMINSGQKVENGETGAWTDFSQGADVCQGGTNNPDIKTHICSYGNPGTIQLGENIATNNGQIQDAFSKLRDCWNDASDSDSDRIADQPWNLTLPVITCPGNSITTCQRIVGAVNLNVLWITGAGEDSLYNDIPLKMGGWTADIHCVDYDLETKEGRESCWNEFVQYYNLQNVDGSDAPYAKKSIYFRPDCNPHIPKGRSGGENFGVLAKIPVLVD